ncbi:MAG: rcc01693 family protein [Shimia sp.]
MRFDWAALVELGLRRLRLTPDAFWALTPAELRLMAGESARATITRSGLDALMAAYPDGDGRKDDVGIR